MKLVDHSIYLLKVEKSGQFLARRLLLKELIDSKMWTPGFPKKDIPRESQWKSPVKKMMSWKTVLS